MTRTLGCSYGSTGWHVMTSRELLEQLKMLPRAERLKIVESTVQELREELEGAPPLSAAESDGRLKRAAQALLADYAADEELTAFTVLDREPFHA